MEEQKNQPASETIVGADVKIKGNFKSPSNIQIFGQVKGRVNSESDVLVGEGARVEGGIKGKQVTVSGEIIGNIEALERLEITSQGILQGDIKTPDLVIQSGAKLTGKCEMPTGELEVSEEVESEGEKNKEESEPDEALEELEETIKE